MGEEDGAKVTGTSADVAEVDGRVTDLQARWEQLTLANSGGPAVDDADALDGDAGQSAGGSCGYSSRSGSGLGQSIDPATVSSIVSWLPVERRMAPRACNRAWLRLSAHGPCRAGWVDALGGAKGLEVVGGNLMTRFCGRSFVAGRCGGKFFKGKPAARGELQAPKRVTAPQPVLSMPDGTAVAVVDTAPPTAMSEVDLAVYDVASLTHVGSIPIAGAKHGRSIQRPLSVLSLRAAAGPSLTGEPQSCVLAMERLVVVFSWWLTPGDTAALQLAGGQVEEVRWSETTKEVLRSASFVELGVESPVAVLLESQRTGSVVEVFARAPNVMPGSGVPTYFLAERVPVEAPKLSAPPKGSPPVFGTMQGCVALWLNIGAKTVEFAKVPPMQTEESQGDDPAAPAIAAAAPGAGGKGAAGRGAGSAVALFARARQGAKKGKLRVDSDGGGCGLDMEAGKWGYEIEEVDDEPGQPDLVAGDCIISIGGMALHGLDDEETVHWRFGRNLKDGAEIIIMQAATMKAIKAAEEAQAKLEAGEEEKKVEAEEEKKVPQQTAHKRRFEMQNRVEAYDVLALGSLVRLAMLADNHLLVCDLGGDDAAAWKPRDVLSGAVRPPWKRPVQKMALLDAGSDLVMIGVPKGVLIWRVPAILAKPGVACADPELLAGVPMPARLSLSSLAFGIRMSSPLGWALGSLDPPNDSGSLDIWQFYTGSKPQALNFASRGPKRRRIGGLGGNDGVSRNHSAVGTAADAVITCFKRALAKSPNASGPSRAWLGQLRDSEAEPLYNAVNSAEQVLGESVRDLRVWIRNHSKGSAASPAARAAREARAELAKATLQWAEECRRMVLWPLQVAFEAEEVQAPDDED